MAPSSQVRSEKTGAEHRRESDDGGRDAKRSRCSSFPPVRALVTLVCCFLFELTLGVSYTTANLLPYLTSYLRNSTGDTSIDYSMTLWVDQGGWMVTSMSLPLLGILEQRIPNRLYFAAGWLAFTVSFIGNYWALQTSFVATIFVYGMLQGLSQGIIYPVSAKLAVSWFPENRALVNGITMAGYGGGAFIWNQIVTAWINPDNLSPDQTVREDLYFTQPELLNRVPSCYLVMGGVMGGIQLICLLAISYPPPSSTTLETDVIVDVESRKERETTLSEDKAPNDKTEKKVVDSGNGVVNPAFVDTDDDGMNIDSKSPTDNTDGEDDDELADKMTVLDILKSRVTWTILLFNLLVDIGFQTCKNFYKAYGQTFIHDDHFLALIASVISAFNAAGRPIWGLIADRIGCLPALLSSLTLLSCVISTFALCDQGGRIMFSLWLCLMYVAVGGVYSLTNPVIYGLFGRKNFVFALGFVYSEGIPVALVLIFGSQALEAAFGWHGVILFAGSACFLSLLVLGSLVLDCGHPLTSRMKRALFVGRHAARGNHESKKNPTSGT